MQQLNVKEVTLKFDGKRVLDRVSMDFRSGRTYAIVGPNGAGKSTLANVMMGLPGYRDHEGDIQIDGASLRDCTVDERARKGLTLAWQEPARFLGLSVHRFVSAGARENGNRARAAGALKQLGLEPGKYLDRAVDKTLSGGERKRIELASILVMDPRIILMDEPDSGIDVEALEHIFEAIRRLNERGTAIILITHSKTVLKQAEHAYLMCDGRVIDEGPAHRIGQYFENKCLPCRHENRPSEEEVA